MTSCVRQACLGFCLGVAAVFPCAADEPVPVLPAQGTMQAAFAPWDDVEGLIVQEIDGARVQVLVQAYLLTSKKIATTLAAAHRRGVDVRVMADAEQVAKTPASMVDELARTGVPVWMETRYQNAHNKVIVIDKDGAGATVITGSYNYTWTAKHRNAENILIVRKHPALAARYAQNWERHRQDAAPYPK